MIGCHGNDVEIGRRCELLARALADQFGYDLRVVEHKRRPHPGGHHGLCYQAECRISIVIRFREGKIWQGSRLHDETVLRTVCHEVAHLPKVDGSVGIGLKDGPAHRAEEQRLLAWAKENGHFSGVAK